jgi:branched-chain amino acid transport system substrate-binding protein
LRKLVRATTLVLALAAGEAPAQENIKIGLILPLTGNSANAGQQARAAVELGAEIVNGTYPDLVGSPLAGSAGLPNLKHARLQIITVNDQGNPAVGAKQVARLIGEEHPVAIQGSYASSVTLAASTVAEQSQALANRRHSDPAFPRTGGGVYRHDGPAAIGGIERLRRKQGA